MAAGMGARVTWGSLKDCGVLGLEPPVTTRISTTTSPMTTTAPPTRVPMRIRCLRSSAARRSAFWRCVSVRRCAFDCFPLVIGASA
jgi:hypothetical protein